MKTVLVTKPATTAVDLEEIKMHCRVDLDDEDTYLEGLVLSATEDVEQVTGRKLITQTWKLLFNEWPGGAEIILPFGECVSVSSIKYIDVDGVEATWDEENYIVDTDSVPGRVVIGYDKSWPSGQLYSVNPIVVEFVTGYGAAVDVPEKIKHAIKMIVKHWHENREPVLVGASVANIPLTVDRLLWPFRLFT